MFQRKVFIFGNIERPDVGCFRFGGCPKVVWVRVVGLPLHFGAGRCFGKLEIDVEASSL